MDFIHFEESTHTYRLGGPNGVVVPSVTQIMKAAGIIDDSFYNDTGRFRGSAVHRATQLLDESDLSPDEGSLDWESLDPELLPYVQAYGKFKLESGFIPEEIEKAVFYQSKLSSYYNKPITGRRLTLQGLWTEPALPIDFAGTLDRAGTFPKLGASKGRYAVLDIKTGSIPSWAGIQLAAYAMLLPSEVPPRRFALLLKKNGKYKLQEFRDEEDYVAFYGACHIVEGKRLINEWRTKNGKSN